MKVLRTYQREAVDSIYEYFAEMDGNPLVVAPTASGKALIIASFIKEMFDKWPDSHVICVAHVKELLEQNEAELKGVWPSAPTGFWSASIGKKQHAPITFAGIASVFKNAAIMGRAELILIDEAHLVPSKGFGMYRRFIDEMRKFNPHVKVVGFTATPFRLDHGLLVDGGHIFTHHCYEVSMRMLIEEGYLCPLRPKKPAGQIDMRGVHIKNHEFVASELEGAAIKVVHAAIDEVIRYGQDRKSWMLFCSGIDHAQMVTKILNSKGYSARLVTGETHKAERADIVAAFGRGDFHALVNVGVFTTGFNVPRVDLIAMLRSTLSASLYIQIAGRGMRLAPGKDDCLFLDFGGNIERHGPIDNVTIKKPGDGDGIAPVKLCPQCEALVAVAKRTCPDCGYEFPVDDMPNHDMEAAAKTLMSWEVVRDIRILDVTRVTYTPHVSGKSGKRSLRVSYWYGMSHVSEYVCLEHDGYAQQKAQAWWLGRDPRKEIPRDVPMAISMSDRLKKPGSVKVDFTEKYPKVIGYS